MSTQAGDPDRDGPQATPELRQALDAWQPSAARAEFRSQLRAQFLAAGQGEPDSPVLTELQQSQLEKELSGSEELTARSEFRERLRGEFLEAGADLALKEEPEPQRTSGSRGARARHEGESATPHVARGPGLRMSLLLGGVAAAAAVLVFLVIPWSTPPSGWRAVDFPSQTEFVIDGQAVSYADSGSLTGAFRKGDCRLSVGDVDLSVVHLGEGVMLEFPAGTRFRIPTRPEAESELLEIELLEGGLRVSTLEEFDGQLLVRTPDTSITLAGSLLGVDVDPRGTCLCIVEGTAEMSLAGGEDEFRRLGANSTTFVERSGVARSEVGAHHAEDLSKFADRRDRYLF